MTYSFHNLEQVRCSMPSSNCCFLTCIQIFQEASKVVWYSHILKNFPQFLVIHTVKSLGTVNKAEIDVFLELPCFFSDPADVGNLISGSSAFSLKQSLKLLNKFAVVHLLNLVWLLATPWAVVHKAPLSMEFSRQAYQSGLPFSSPGDLPSPDLLHCRLILYHLSHQGSLNKWRPTINIICFSIYLWLCGSQQTVENS